MPQYSVWRHLVYRDDATDAPAVHHHTRRAQQEERQLLPSHSLHVHFVDLCLLIHHRVVYIRHLYFIEHAVLHHTYVHLSIWCFFQRRQEVHWLRVGIRTVQEWATRPRDFTCWNLLSSNLLNDWAFRVFMVYLYLYKRRKGDVLQREHPIPSPNFDWCCAYQVLYPSVQPLQDAQKSVQVQRLWLLGLPRSGAHHWEQEQAVWH